MNLIPSKNDIVKYGTMAIGGIAGEMGSKLVKENVKVDFINKYPIIVDVAFMVGGIGLSSMKGMKEIGMGMAVSATSNVILEGYNMLKPAPVPSEK